MDYFQILNLQKEPFSNSPEPEFFFQSDQHRACLQKLELALRLRRGLNVVMGEVGTGKTTLCRQLILNLSRTEEDRETIETHLILDPSFSNGLQFLSAVAEVFGIFPVAEDADEWQFKERIKNYLFHRGIDEQKTVILIIDEGQKIPDFCLEMLREFLNYETNEYKLLQIVIFAQKELQDVLHLRQNFADRVNQYYLLGPLDFRNTRKMIDFRLASASLDPSSVPALFTWPALWAIYRATDGYPRKIITLCHQIMLAMIIQNRAQAGMSLVNSCAKRVSPHKAPRWPRLSLAATVVGLIVVFGLMQYGGGNFLSFPLPKGTGKVTATAVTVGTAPTAPVRVVAETQTAMQAMPVSLPAVVEEKKEAEPPKKNRSAMLGQLVVQKNDRVLRMLRQIYGAEAKLRLKSVARANPQIANLNRVRKGDVVNVPVHQHKTNPLPPGKHWIQVAAFDSLRAAYRFIQEATELPDLFLLPYWNEKEGTVFAVLLKQEFADEQTAASAVKALSPSLAVGTKVVSGWQEETVFL